MEPQAKQARLSSHKPTTDIKSACTESHSHFQPHSLFDICISFVGFNLNIVESLEGFPDLIGEKLFEFARDADLLTSNDIHTERKMRLFNDAYNIDVLHSVDLSHCHLGIADCVSLLAVFTYLRELDLGHCGLGDEHEFLAHINNLNQLCKLSLRDNALSDAGVRRFTTPVRVLQRGPLGLDTLDMSENKSVTARGIRYLNCFTRLTVLNLSDTGVTDKDVGVVESRLGMTRSTDGPCSTYAVSERGWAVGVVHGWMDAAKTRAERPHMRTQSSFYKKIKINNPERRSFPTDTTHTGSIKIHLVARRKEDSSHLITVTPGERDHAEVSVPQYKRNNSTLNRKALPTKLPKSDKFVKTDGALNDETDLDIYTSCYLTTGSSSRPSSLMMSLDKL